MPVFRVVGRPALHGAHGHRHVGIHAPVDLQGLQGVIDIGQAALEGDAVCRAARPVRIIALSNLGQSRGIGELDVATRRLDHHPHGAREAGQGVTAVEVGPGAIRRRSDAGGGKVDARAVALHIHRQGVIATEGGAVANLETDGVGTTAGEIFQPAGVDIRLADLLARGNRHPAAGTRRVILQHPAGRQAGDLDARQGIAIGVGVGAKVIGRKHHISGA